MRKLWLSISLLPLDLGGRLQLLAGIGFSLAEVDIWSAGLRAIAAVQDALARTKTNERLKQHTTAFQL